MARRWFVLVVLAAGCKPSGDVGWALDPMWLEPAENGVHGFQTWELFRERWYKHPAKKQFVCSYVVEIDAVALDADGLCDRCDQAFATEVSTVETDCPAPWSEEPAFLDLTRIGLGTLDPLLVDGDPHPGVSMGSYAEYGDDNWVVHGWAWPESLPEGDADAPSWTGDEPLVLHPAYAWDLVGE